MPKNMPKALNGAPPKAKKGTFKRLIKMLYLFNKMFCIWTIT